jgi:hypothetical protein
MIQYNLITATQHIFIITKSTINEELKMIL